MVVMLAFIIWQGFHTEAIPCRLCERTTQSPKVFSFLFQMKKTKIPHCKLNIHSGSLLLRHRYIGTYCIENQISYEILKKDYYETETIKQIPSIELWHKKKFDNKTWWSGGVKEFPSAFYPVIIIYSLSPLYSCRLMQVPARRWQS